MLLPYVVCWTASWIVTSWEWGWGIWGTSAFGLMGAITGTVAFYVSAHARGVRVDDMGVLGRPLTSLQSSVHPFKVLICPIPTASLGSCCFQTQKNYTNSFSRDKEPLLPSTTPTPPNYGNK
ncbi:hypothetical protein C8R45DRAFT_955215 [Mycena sanguinolenta]|nr:hypothetical protein C8R45DRAFT_955215 [Mycena sanguinolenta]